MVVRRIALGLIGAEEGGVGLAVLLRHLIQEGGRPRVGQNSCL